MRTKLRCPKCRSTQLRADRRTLKPYGWRVWCGGSKPCQWSEWVSQREIIGTAILRWLAREELFR